LIKTEDEEDEEDEDVEDGVAESGEGGGKEEPSLIVLLSSMNFRRIELLLLSRSLVQPSRITLQHCILNAIL
jgi:hypothetical protein